MTLDEPRSPFSLAAVLGALLLASCADPCGDAAAALAAHQAPSGTAPGPFRELYDQGLARYVGRYQPESCANTAGGYSTYTFGGDDGPLCFTGQRYHFSTRPGPSDALMIFLQGGGACGPNGCEAVEGWPTGLPGPLRGAGILNIQDAENPAAQFDQAYLPYCDGSLWTGDAEVDKDGDGTVDYRFRGLKNLSASLDVIAATFPSPSRILLIGNSAGGFGTHAALPLLRLHYPEVPIDLVNDSGVGILAPGGQAATNDYWNAWDFYPASCTDCIGQDGNLTGYHHWKLAQDPRVRMGFMSTRRDGVVLERLPIEPAAWEAELVQAMDELQTAHPDRFRSFIANGDGHTFVLRDFTLEVGGTNARAWIADMLTGGEWLSVKD